MNVKSLEKYYLGTIIFILGLIIVHAPLSVFIGSKFPDYALFVKAWKEVLMFLAAIVAVIIITKKKMWPGLLRDKLLWLVAAFVFVHIASLFLSASINEAIAGLMINLRYIVFFVLCYVLVKMNKDWRAPLQKTALAGALIVIAFACAQVFLPHDFLKAFGYSKDTIAPYTTVDQNYDYVRLQSTLRGPNPLGAYAAAVTTIAVAVAFREKRLRNQLVVLAGIAAIVCYLSYSRSAYIAMIVGVAGVAFLNLYRYLDIRHYAIGGVILLVAGFGIFMTSGNSTVSTILLHEDPNEGGMINSNDDHFDSLIDGTDRMLRQPLGAGIGSTGSASLLGNEPVIIENQYLFIAHEVGWIGLAMFAVLFTWILLRLWSRRSDAWAFGMCASGIGLAIIGLLLPVWVDDTVSVVWWGLAGAIIGSNYGRRTTNKKAA